MDILIENLEDSYFPDLVYYYNCKKNSKPLTLSKCLSNTFLFLRPNLIDYYNILCTDYLENELLTIEELKLLSLEELQVYTLKIKKEINYYYLHLDKYCLNNGIWRIKGEF